MVQITQKKGTFRAHDEAGTIFVVHRYEGPDGSVLVDDRSGGPVRRIDRGLYELAGPHPIRLSSDDRHAP